MLLTHSIRVSLSPSEISVARRVRSLQSLGKDTFDETTLSLMGLHGLYWLHEAMLNVAPASQPSCASV